MTKKAGVRQRDTFFFISIHISKIGLFSVVESKTGSKTLPHLESTINPFILN